MQTSRLIASSILGCAVLGAFVASPVPVQAAQTAPQAAAAGAASASFAPAELARLKKAAQRVTILRDKWGIPHVFGRLDADAVFGMVFAQAEDDFNRVELNYINAMGRLAEVEGEKDVLFYKEDIEKQLERKYHPGQ